MGNGHCALLPMTNHNYTLTAMPPITSSEGAELVATSWREGSSSSQESTRQARRNARRRSVSENLLRKPRLWLERYPVTLLLCLQYGPLVIYPAWRNHTNPEGAIIGISLLAILSALIVEVLLSPAGLHGRRSSNLSIGFVRCVMAVGWLASGAQALTGQGSYQSQINAASQTKLASLFTPFQNWPLFAAFLVLWLFRQERLSRRSTYCYLGLTIALEFGLTLYEAIFSPLMSTLLALIFGAILVRLIRLRWVVLIVIAAPLVWSPLYNLRNDVRLSVGGNVTEIGLHQAPSRLRLDLEFGQIAEFPHIPIAIGHDSAFTLIRYGLLPRALDPSRPPLRTGSDLSVALGSSSTSSDTLTTVGDIYVEYGWHYVMFVFAGIAAIVAWTIRRRGPWSMCILGLLVSQALWIESTWPNIVPAVLQGTVSLGVVWLLYRCWPSTRRDRPQLVADLGGAG